MFVIKETRQPIRAPTPKGPLRGGAPDHRVYAFYLLSLRSIRQANITLLPQRGPFGAELRIVGYRFSTFFRFAQ